MSVEILKILDKLECFAKNQATDSTELLRVLTSGCLHHNLRFSPKKVKITDYIRLLDALQEYQENHSDDLGTYIASIDEFIQDNLSAKTYGDMDLESIRKKYVGRTINVDGLKEVENITCDKGTLNFYFYLQDDFSEYKCDVTLIMKDSIIEKIKPIKESVLAGEDARRVNYKPIKTIKEHYKELDELLKNACK